MTRPLSSGKQSVKLASPGVYVSRIRRDPPPKVKEVTVEELKEREAWMVAVGVVAFALALFLITLGIASYNGWSPRDYTVEV